MTLSPEERRKIYEEEKARVDAEQKEQITAGGSTTGLEPNIAGLLCYLGFWVTGIIFLVIEQKNKFVRFHALQSIITFGALAVIGLVLGLIPYAGSFFGAVIGIISIVLWIILMVKAHQGELYKVPLAGQVAAGILPAEWRAGKPESGGEQSTDESAPGEGTTEQPESAATAAPSTSKKDDKVDRRQDGPSRRARADTIAGYSVVIFFNVALLIFFTFFHRYIAWYSTNPDGSITRLPLLTAEYFTFLPILVTAFVITIVAYIILILYDPYWLRETVQIALAAIGVAVIVSLLSIFPFDFSVIPNATVASFMPGLVTVIFVLIAVGLGIAALVRFIKLMVTVGQ
ncbi:MAG: DUF4870 domain-containing protein [Dehalococcoidia bacterium]|nr:DUF4870 domain-containing protein [Dehalococcoidia bacterium]